MVVIPALQRVGIEGWYYVNLVIESTKDSEKNSAELQYKQGFMGLQPPGNFALSPVDKPLKADAKSPMN
jgi:hypothetical protein